jgi:hypothetical protein
MLASIVPYLFVLSFLYYDAQLQSVPELDRQSKIALVALGKDVVAVLKEKDIEALASLTHPEKGIRFSPY